MKKSTAVFVAFWSLSACVWAGAVNVRDKGAVGDGKADDTAALQSAIDAAAGDPSVAELLIPAGQYRITRTLQTNFKFDNLLVRGEGNKTTLIWDGDDGGTLLRAFGIGHNRFEGLCFAGQPLNSRLPKKAGILFLVESSNGAGSMQNHFTDIQFLNAGTGMQMGTDERNPCNADIYAERILFQRLDRGFLARNNQAVDFLFNFVFVLECNTVFHFERGGNLCLNNCQMSQSANRSTFLRIDGGGRCCSTFTCSNVRLEGGGGKVPRFQLVSATNIFWEQAQVKFIGFDDIMWQWFKNTTENRSIPLCDIGPGVNVTFESSTFNGPLAKISGKPNKPGSLVVRECTFGYLLPHQAIEADENGFFKTQNCFNDHMVPLRDVVKWPDYTPMKIESAKVWKPELPPPASSSEAAEEKLSQAMAEWLKEGKPSP